MIIRAKTIRTFPALTAAVALLGVFCDVSGTPVAVTDYRGLVGTIGSDEKFQTGERFSREGLVLIHKGGLCQPDFDEMGLGGFGRHPDMYSLVSVDVDHAEQDDVLHSVDGSRAPMLGSKNVNAPTTVFFKYQDLLVKLQVDPAALSDPVHCPSLAIIPRRSPVESPRLQRPGRDPRSNTFHLPTVRSQQVSVGIVNEMDFDLDIHYQWWDEPSRPTHIRTLAPTMENWMLSYKTTTMIALNKETQEEVARYLVKGNGLFTVAQRECGVDTCGISEASELPQDRASQEARRQHDQGRLLNNKRQPEGLPRFTEVGFKKVRVPDDVWDVVMTYYEDNKDTPKKEKWNKNNVFTNNVEAPSYMVNLPENGEVKRQIFDGIRPILEEWSGVELVQTACYGIRVYMNTSWLANHVDTRSTHAVSVIMNVDQEVDEDWPLMIYDHAGNDYNITMKPRDLVLYESATCVHGRPSTFHGQFYANAFIHYRPKDPEKWAKYAE